MSTIQLEIYLLSSSLKKFKIDEKTIQIWVKKEL